jgi:hypothetical protein
MGADDSPAMLILISAFSARMSPSPPRLPSPSSLLFLLDLEEDTLNLGTWTDN